MLNLIQEDCNRHCTACNSLLDSSLISSEGFPVQGSFMKSPVNGYALADCLPFKELVYRLKSMPRLKMLLVGQAEKARESHVAAAALKGSEAVAHAKAVSAAIRAKEESDGTRRRAELDLKLQRAIDARYEMTQTMLASLTLVRPSPPQLLLPHDAKNSSCCPTSLLHLESR